MEEKKLDLNSIIGFGLIFLILVWIIYQNQPSEATIAADKAKKGLVAKENANKVCQYLDKGSKVYLEGELEYGTYKNKEGVEVPSTKIIANVIDIIKGKDKEEIDKHSIEKGNGYAPQTEDFNDEIFF